MSTAWPTNGASKRVASDNVSSGARVYTLGQYYYDRDRCMMGRGTFFYVPAYTESNGSYVTRLSREVRLPAYALLSESGVIRLTIMAQVQAATTLYFRMIDVGSGTVGTEITQGDSSGAYVPLTSVLTIPGNTWAGTFRTLGVQTYKTGAGVPNVNTKALLNNLRFGD